MIDTVKSPIEGRFKVEVLKDFEVIDSFEDHNTICINARRGMASIFSNIIEHYLYKCQTWHGKYFFKYN